MFSLLLPSSIFQHCVAHLRKIKSQFNRNFSEKQVIYLTFITSGRYKNLCKGDVGEWLKPTLC